MFDTLRGEIGFVSIKALRGTLFEVLMERALLSKGPRFRRVGFLEPCSARPPVDIFERSSIVFRVAYPD